MAVGVYPLGQVLGTIVSSRQPAMASENRGMGAREWAAIGNLYKLSAVAGFLASLWIADQAFNHRVPANFVTGAWAGAVAMLVLSILLWNLKGFLVRGNLILRVLVGLYTLGWIVGTLGFGLIVILIIYLFTSNPSAYETSGRGGSRKSLVKAPRKWSPTAKVGPAGAMLYRDSSRADASGIFDSYTPVQVVDRQGSAARIVSANGESGWVDLRSLTETA